MCRPISICTDLVNYCLTGALGSGPLLFIMPCLFHNKLQGDHIQRTVYVKNVAIMVFGVVASVIGLGVSLYQTFLLLWPTDQYYHHLVKVLKHV